MEIRLTLRPGMAGTKRLLARYGERLVCVTDAGMPGISDPGERLVTAALAALAIYKHRANIERLLKGTESRVGAKKKEATP